MKSNKQEQKSGDSSINIQAQQITLSSGLQPEDVRQIALDVFGENFLKLSGIATETARKRAEEITEKFLSSLMDRNPDGLSTANDPDMQYAIFTAQKEYARSGDKELGDLLVDILVDRTKEEDRNIIQIVLNESLSTVPKLTKAHIYALSTVFMLRYTVYLHMENLESLSKWLEDMVLPFIEPLTKNASCYQHLTYTGCASISIGQADIEKILKRNYPGLFSKGFEESALTEFVNTYGVPEEFFIKCLHNTELFQINAIDEKIIHSKAEKAKLSNEATSKLIEVMKSRLMKDNEVKEYLRTIHPSMDGLFNVWDNSLMKNISLTSVGIAIGHANVRRVLNQTFDLSIWIN